ESLPPVLSTPAASWSSVSATSSYISSALALPMIGTSTACSVSGELPPDDNVPQPDTQVITPSSVRPASRSAWGRSGIALILSPDKSSGGSILSIDTSLPLSTSSNPG